MACTDLLASEFSTELEETGDAVAVLEPAVHTHAHDGEHAHVHNGYGACSISGCPCQSYMGQDNLCQNCGHQYTAHW
jgi:hypothetical protein